MKLNHARCAAGPRKSGQGVEDEEQGIISAEQTPSRYGAFGPFPTICHSLQLIIKPMEADDNHAIPEGGLTADPIGSYLLLMPGGLQPADVAALAWL